jgi:histidyl-tRNA synthetase
LEFLEVANVKYDLDPRLVRGLGYYGKTVFELVVTDNQGSQNAIAGGGRYDNLIELYCGRKIPAIGMAFGIDRIIELMKDQKIKLHLEKLPQIFIAQLGEEAKKQAMLLLDKLQEENILARAALSKNTLKSQLKVADSFNIPLTLILGQKEVLDGTIIIRDMKAGSQEIVKFDQAIPKIKSKLKI